MTKIKNIENQLFEKYREQHPDMVNIVKDGLVSEDDYFSAKYKILYILKEVNGGENWDLREFLADGGRPNTWDNVARWTAGIFKLPEEQIWKIVEKQSDNKASILKSIGVVNLKKDPGTHMSNYRDLKKASIKNRDILKKQLSLYKPDIIVCGGTLYLFLEACYEENEYEWYETNRGITYVIDKNGTVIIGYVHPEARVADQILHYALMDAVKEISDLGFLNEGNQY